MPVISVSLSNEGFDLLRQGAEAQGFSISAVVGCLLRDWGERGAPTLTPLPRKERSASHSRAAREEYEEPSRPREPDEMDRLAERMRERRQEWASESWSKQA